MEPLFLRVWSGPRAADWFGGRGVWESRAVLAHTPGGVITAVVTLSLLEMTGPGVVCCSTLPADCLGDPPENVKMSQYHTEEGADTVHAEF